tara:strand:- start:8668 stop:9132 length:465 start_codon:yes stop_codon:yes gene_type:complete
MEFLLFLSSRETEILNLIQKSGYSVEENTPLCLLGDEYVGFFKRRQKRVVICTNNAKRKAGYFVPRYQESDEFHNTAIYIRRALRHESVHVAQQCNKDNLIEIDSKKKLKINPYKLKALEGSTNISGKREHEYQAYTLEDNPKLIVKALKRYCL